MHIGTALYESVKIACVCWMSVGEQPLDGVYKYAVKDFPFRSTCANPAIIDPARAHHKRPANYRAVSIQDCVPPDGGSYGTILKSLGIQTISDFSLSVSEPAKLTSTSFKFISPFLDRVWIAGSGKLILQRAAVAVFNTVQSLQLSQVEADRFPRELQYLELNNTSYQELPQETLNRKSVSIEDKTLKTIWGKAKALRSLYLDTPALESVSLWDVSVEVLRGAWRKSPALRRLHLSGLYGFGSSLPEDLFSSSPNLNEIEISETKELQVLPEGLFAGLPNLKIVSLAKNKLSASVLVALKKVNLLTKLYLNKNSLGDLCTEGGESSLRQFPALEYVALSDTKATRVCVDWLRPSGTLREVDLSNNAISRVSCADLVAESKERPYIILSGNGLEDIICTEKMYNRAVEDEYTVKVVYRWTDQNTPCHCNLYWLWKLARQTKDAEIFSRHDRKPKCSREWKVCHPGDDQIFKIEYEEPDWYRTSCEDAALDDFERPGLPTLTVFKDVTLTYCVPGEEQTYVSTLQALNVNFTNQITLLDVPADAGFTAKWIADLPSSLHKFKLRALAKRNSNNLHRYHQLNLIRLPVGLLPRHLTEVSLKGIGLQSLYAEAIETVQFLELVEENLWSFRGTLPELTKLILSAPVDRLPEAPRLQHLELYEAKPETLSGFPALTRVTVNQLILKALPTKFLLDSHSLLVFTASQNNFESLPSDLFAYSPMISEIDLSKNHLQSLPSGLFSGLKELRHLDLRDNLLQAKHFNVLSHIKTLKTLDLSQNSIGEFCSKGFSPLYQLPDLNHLNLSQSKIWSICPDWLEMRHLGLLDLSGNYIQSPRCADLRAHREVPAKILLENNTFNTIACSWPDHEEAFFSEPPKQKVVVKTSKLICTCDTYWLTRVTHVPSAAFKLEAKYERTCYSDKDRECRVRTECPRSQTGCKNEKYTEDDDIYLIYGDKLVLQYDASNIFSMFCSQKIALDHPALPVFPRMTHFNTVKLHGCVPQKNHKRISNMLLSLNITIGDNLYLNDLPLNTNFTSVSLMSLPTLKALHLEAAEYLVIPNGVLRQVNPITSLTLVRVHSEEVPQYLKQLTLIETGFEELQPGALQAQELTIVEKKPISLSGYSAKLKKLTVTAPKASLLEAPALHELDLTGVKPADGFLEGYPDLHTLILRQLSQQQLPDTFLRGGSQLRHLVIANSSITTLPNDFFSYSPHLETIDLSNNKLDSLSRDEFSTLAKLERLNVANNQLGYINPEEYKFVKSLKEFKYDGNEQLK